MSDVWSRFVATEQGNQLREFLLKLNRKIGKAASGKEEQEGILLLNTRKGYWVYKIFEKEEADHIFRVMVYSDRYVQKMSDLSALEGKMIYLADDTLVHGYSLLETYELLAEVVEEDMICPIVYAMNGEIDIEQKMQSATGRSKNFWSKLQYFLLMSEDELGELSIKETQLIHAEGIPNMIDLPYLKDAGRTAHALDFQVHLTGSQFKALQKERQGWEFHFNSCKVENETVLQGFIIQMKNEPLLESTSEFVHDYVMEGTYLVDEDGNVKAVFTPFAILKSINKAFLLKLWNDLFDGTEKYIDSNTGNDTNKWIGYYKECVYALSMMVAECFGREVADKIGFAFSYDYEILKDHFPDDMIQRMRTLEKAMKAEENLFSRRLEKIYGIKNQCSGGDRIRISEGGESRKQYHGETLFKEIHEIILKNKDELKKSQGTLSHEQKLASILEIGQMERYAERRFAFKTEQEKRYALTREIVTILRSSICNNKLESDRDGECLIRGFRYGENSDLLLPFFDLYFYWAVVLLASKYTMDGAARRYKSFVSGLKDLYEAWGLLGDDAAKENFDLNKNYYNRVLEGKQYLYNKFCFVQPYLRGRLDDPKAFYMEKMEEFVERYCWLVDERKI